MKPIVKKRLVILAKYLVLTVVVIVVFMPLIGVIFSAFKTQEEYFTTSRLTLPESFFNFDNFIKIFTKGKIMTGFLNTFIIMVCSLGIAMFLSTMVAYVLDRFEFKGKKSIQYGYLIASFVPGITTQIVTFKIVNSLHLVNTLGAPVILYIGVDVVSMYIFLQFIKEIPVSLDEAAMVEGASYFTIYRKIILPLLKPAIVTVCLIKGTAIYNDFYTPFLYLPSADKGVMSTMLYRFMGPFSSNWGVIAAGIIIVILPIFIVFILMQKQIYKGFTDGAVK